MAETTYIHDDELETTFRAAESLGYDTLTKKMTATAREVMESGGVCDEASFLLAMCGSRRPYGSSAPQLPLPLQKSLDVVDSLEFSAGEPYSTGVDSNMYGGIDGILTHQSVDKGERPVTSHFSIEYTDVGFVGIVAVQSLSLFNGHSRFSQKSETETRPHLISFLHLRRPESARYPVISGVGEFPYTVGLPNIRRQLVLRGYDVKKLVELDDEVERLRNMAGDTARYVS